MKRMIVMRGLPGAGKDYNLDILVGEYKKEVVVCSADDFFMENGEYVFVPWKIGQAHESCKLKCFRAMAEGKHVAISNTNVQKWEYELYLEMAMHFGYEVTVMSIFDGGCTNEELAKRNQHGVPLEAIEAMRDRWEK
jgi:predicted kinase